MRHVDKRRKFHEAVLNTLYPPPPSPPPSQVVNEPVNKIAEDFQVELINPDDYTRSSSNSSDDEEDGEGRESEPQKLTRAQRKRLRKKKIQEDASRLGKIVGPLLPPSNNNDGGGGGKNVTPRVRKNADKECTVTSGKTGELSGCSNQNKLKNRRKAKKLARDRLKCSTTEKYHNQDQKVLSHSNNTQNS